MAAFKKSEFSNFCCQCGMNIHLDDHSPVTWKCIACKGFCCRKCALINPANREYYGETYCSFACRDAWRVQSSMLGLSLEDD